jgi:hypothetical protein
MFKEYCNDIIQTLQDTTHLEVGGHQVSLEWIVGGDLKFLSQVMGHAGQSCNYPCPWCEVFKEFLHSHRGEMPVEEQPKLRSYEDAGRLSHIFPTMGDVVSFKCAGCQKNVTKEEPQLPTNETQTRKFLGDHFGTYPGKGSVFSLPFNQYVVDILHTDLRIVPTLYFFGVTIRLMSESAGLAHNIWMRDNLKICISRKWVKWNKGTTNLAKESLDGKSCLAIVDQADRVLSQVHKEGSPQHKDAKATFDAYRVVRLLLWKPFDCSKEEQAEKVRVAAVEFVHQFTRSYGAMYVGVYMHILQDHVPAFIAAYGSLVPFCCQGAEAVHQPVKRNAKYGSRGGGRVRVTKAGEKARGMTAQVIRKVKVSVCSAALLPTGRSVKKARHL